VLNSQSCHIDLNAEQTPSSLSSPSPATLVSNDLIMPVAPPFPSTVNNPQSVNNSLYPALYLYPLNDTWAPKHITLSNQHTKIGRQTSSKTAPGERNGFFDSKVLSRQHAEVWEENNKVP
jgi:hypothetical protein